MARWGVGLSIAGMVASVAFGVLYYSFYQKFAKTMNAAGTAQFGGWEGVTAPDFTVTTVDGHNIKLSDLKGKRVVLDFWATWNPLCQQEIPLNVQLYGDTSRDKLEFVGISQEPADVLKDFAQKKGINYPIASATRLPAPFDNITTFPTTFFIDSHGVIQKVVVGYHDYAALKSDALAADYQGTPGTPPAPLADAPQMLKPVVVWSHSVPGAQTMSVGDWDNDGSTRVLVAAGPTLHVLDLSGAEKSVVPLPSTFRLIEFGRSKANGPQLLGFNNWGQDVEAVDHSGKKLWGYHAAMGIDGAHWGDLDGDGFDEMIIGMNGFGGLAALSSDGKKIWSVKLGNVWNQAIVPATPNRPGRVFATEAGGSVREYDATGHLLRTLRPGGAYFAQMTARAIDDKTIQIIGISQNLTEAFDEHGTVAWKTSAIPSAGGWRACCFAAGDLKGDGSMQWVFLDGSADLIIATPTGQKLAAIPNQRSLDSFSVASRGPGQGGLLVTLDHGNLTAYDLQP
jgi:peroxiredoxin